MASFHRSFSVPSIKLTDGHSIPALGLGTWKLRRKECKDSVKEAIDIGYRHIDTAEIYWNESEVGEAIKGFDRKKLFITSKVWPHFLGYKRTISACEASLRRLGSEYIDLYLIHWPNFTMDLKGVLKAFKDLQDRGKIVSAGVSNFSVKQLKSAIGIAKDFGLQIANDQVEFYPGNYQKSLLSFAQSNGVSVTAYSPLARGSIVSDEVISGLAQKYKRTPAQIALRWAIQKGTIVIPKASSRAHLKENFDIFDFEIKERDIERLDSLGNGNL